MKSIRWQITVPFVVLIIVMMAAVAGFSAWKLRQSYLARTESNLAFQSNLIADEIYNQPAAPLSGAELQTKVDRWAILLEARITVVDPKGVVLADSEEDPSRMDNHLNRPEIVESLQAGTGSSIRFSHTLGFDMFYSARAVRSGGEPLGYVRLAVPLQALQADISHLRATLVWLALGVAFVAVFLAFLISNRISKPVRELTQAVRKITPISAEEPASFAKNQSEVALLTQSFNHLSNAIQEKIQRLEEEKGKTEAILQEMSDGVVVVDEDMAIHVMNKAARKMFDVELLAVEGKKLIEVIRLHQPVELLQSAMAADNEQTQVFEINKTRQFIKGTAIPTRTYLPGMYLLLFQDLTVQKQAESLRREFVSNVSHELRNPLSVIKLLSETLLDGAIAQPETAQHFLQQINGEADKINGMVNELLDLSKVESGRLTLDLGPIKLCVPIKNACERLALQAKQKDLDVVVKCGGDQPLIRGDEARIEQILINLIHNAIKFSHQGGQITVSVTQEGPFARYEVRDAGQGIAETDLPHVFERFFKADKSRSSEGVGLGLAVARHLVEAQGGRITAESKLGEGSVFAFTIPLIN